MSEDLREDDQERRKMILVAREGVLTQIIEEYDFPTPNHRKVIEVLYHETVNEMHDLGLVEIEDEFLEDKFDEFVNETPEPPPYRWEDREDGTKGS